MGRLSKAKWCLLGCLIILLLIVVGSVFVPAQLTDAIEWVANSHSAGELRALTTQGEIQEEGLVEMVVESVGIGRVDYQPLVLLREKDGETYLPIWIGPAEATAIVVVLEEVEVPRPLTPDLLRSIVQRMGASVTYIIVNDLRDETFYANLVLQADWKQLKIDARPSDAIAVALRVEAPIYVTEAVLEKAGIPREQKTGEQSVRLF